MEVMGMNQNVTNVSYTTQSRWRSSVLWAALISQLIVILGLLGLWDQLGITSDTFQGIAAAVLEILTLLGVINNPTSKTSW
jgi:uncharacterized membrane protein